MGVAEDRGGWRQGRYRFLPVVPGRMEFAAEVRQALLAHRPRRIAVELPQTLEAATLRAVSRLPEVSVILYPDSSGKGAVYVPVEITDPFMEALRSGGEVGAAIHFVDPDLDQPPHLPQVYPDSYAVRRIGYVKYVESWLACPQPANHRLRRHAQGIAWRLQSLPGRQAVWVVLSLNLFPWVLQALGEPQAEPLARQRRPGVQVLNLHPECLAEVLVEPPFVQAVYERCRQPSQDAGVETAEPDPPPGPQNGPFRVIASQAEDPRRALESIVERTARRVGWRAAPGRPVDASAEDAAVAGVGSIDRQRMIFRLLAESERRYGDATGESVSHWQRRLLGRYARNLAFLDRQLAAGLFDLTVAARSVVDDNYAWDLWELAGGSPHQRIHSDVMTVRISGEELYVNMRRIQLRRRLPRRKAQVRPYGLRGRRKEEAPGEWARRFDGSGICSYPPEDLVLEDYGAFLKKKGKSVLSAERSRVEVFKTSMLDGIDVRETLRNWHQGQLYVREYQRVSGEVGAVVVVFDEDPENRYHWRTTWLGEHAQESDMAFYSTNPYDRIVGPGIARAEYGGFLLSYPPRRMLDVWQDPEYGMAETKAETLLLAGLDYTLERFMVYVAARPPRSIFRTIASRMGRKIVYLPIGQLSPVSLKKIRVVHVLEGFDKRPLAKDYIW